MKNLEIFYFISKFNLITGGEQEYRITDGLGPKPKTERQNFEPFRFCFSEVLNPFLNLLSSDPPPPSTSSDPFAWTLLETHSATSRTPLDPTVDPPLESLGPSLEPLWTLTLNPHP